MVYVGRVTRIDVLPDVVLLGIFDFYVDISSYDGKSGVEAWQSLVHVCRRWRTLVLESPRRLNLQLYCRPKTAAKGTLDVWPALPLIVKGFMALSGTDNILAALGQSNRVCHLSLSRLLGWQLEQVSAAMQVPFPELTDLRLISDGETMPVIPSSFMEGSAPRLRSFELSGIPFPGLPNLLLSATRLVKLRLYKIPQSGYISPEAIVALISLLSGLEILLVEFQSPQSRPNNRTRRPPPSKRSVIHSLTSLTFKGVVEYLEDLVTGIDTPQLNRLDITLFNQIDFDAPRLAQFINRTPKPGKRDATVLFSVDSVVVELPPGTFKIAISCREPDWQLSSIEQVCNSSLHPLSTVEHLYIEHKYRQLAWKIDAIESTVWLQFLLPFTSVKDLYLSKEFAPGISATLKELIGGRITEVLPCLQNIFVEGLMPGPFQESIGQFVAARQISDHPIAISAWERDPIKVTPSRQFYCAFIISGLIHYKLNKPTKNGGINMIIQPIPPFKSKTKDTESAKGDATATSSNELNINATSFMPKWINMTIQPIPPFKGKKSQPTAQPSNGTTLTTTKPPGSGAGAQPTKNAEPAKGDAAAAASNKLNIKATSLIPNRKNMTIQPIPPFKGKKAQPTAQPSNGTTQTTTKPSGSDAGAQPTENAESAKGDAAAAASNKLNINATRNPKAAPFVPVIYHRITRVNSLTLFISVSRLPRTRLLVHRQIAN